MCAFIDQFLEHLDKTEPINVFIVLSIIPSIILYLLFLFFPILSPIIPVIYSLNFFVSDNEVHSIFSS